MPSQKDRKGTCRIPSSNKVYLLNPGALEPTDKRSKSPDAHNKPDMTDTPPAQNTRSSTVDPTGIYITKDEERNQHPPAVPVYAMDPDKGGESKQHPPAVPVNASDPSDEGQDISNNELRAIIRNIGNDLVQRSDGVARKVDSLRLEISHEILEVKESLVKYAEETDIRLRQISDEQLTFDNRLNRQQKQIDLIKSKLQTSVVHGNSTYAGAVSGNNPQHPHTRHHFADQTRNVMIMGAKEYDDEDLRMLYKLPCQEMNLKMRPDDLLNIVRLQGNGSKDRSRPMPVMASFSNLVARDHFLGSRRRITGELTFVNIILQADEPRDVRRARGKYRLAAGYQRRMGAKVEMTPHGIIINGTKYLLSESDKLPRHLLPDNWSPNPPKVTEPSTHTRGRETKPQNSNVQNPSSSVHRVNLVRTAPVRPTPPTITTEQTTPKTIDQPPVVCKSTQLEGTGGSENASACKAVESGPCSNSVYGVRIRKVAAGIRFAGKTAFLSNWFGCTIKKAFTFKSKPHIEEKEYNFTSSEQAYAFAKSTYHEDDRTARAIMTIDDAAKIRAAAKCITVDEDWDFIKEEVLEEVMTAKFA